MNRVLVLVIVAVLAAPQIVQGLDTAARLVSPIRTWETADLERYDPAWLHAKFVEGSNVRLENGLFADENGLDLGAVNDLVLGRPVLEIHRTFPHDRQTLRMWKAMGEERSGVNGPDLSLWFDVKVDGGRAAVAELVNGLNTLPQIEIAHPAPIVEPAVLRTPEPTTAPPTGNDALTPDFTPQQGYLFDTPVGLDAPAVWILPGGRGATMKFIDVELCWTPDHEDFNYGNYFYEGGAPMDPNYETHGTAVLGEVIGQPNGYGVTGFASDVDYGVVAITVAEWPYVPHYFQEAVDHLDPGDVWLIELQMYPPGKGATPMEWVQVNYDVIWTSSWGLGIVCVEAGANGSQNLDDPSWGGVFDRNLRDSGAIMVAAGTPTGRVAEWFTNYGSRMDVHAWGSQITTTGYGDLYNGGTLQTRYTAGFGGTSGASPMVTGSALCLQGVARENLGYILDPIELRSILHDTGIDHLDPTKEIGPRPDLGAAGAAVRAMASVREDGLLPAVRLTGTPNPFSSASVIRFSIPTAGDVELGIYDAGGRLVRTLLNGPIDAGEHRVTWDGRDDAGRDLQSGIYFFHLRDDRHRRAGRIEKIR